jgi:hypothetical protein
MGVMLDAPWNGVVFAPPTPIDIATIEDAIVTQLRSQISSIEITHVIITSGGLVHIGNGPLAGVARLGDRVQVGETTGTIVSASTDVLAG